jgi:hypothetical protein
MSAQSESVQKERAHPLRYVDDALPPLHGLVNVWHVETLIRQDVYTLQENAYSARARATGTTSTRSPWHHTALRCRTAGALARGVVVLPGGLRGAPSGDWRAARHQATAALAPLPLGFVEVPSVPAGPPPTGTTQIELARADGPRLCIHTPLAPLLLDALVRAFVEGRACCN